MNSIHHYDQVYFVEAPKNMPMNPVAIRPEIFESKVHWLDTSRGVILELGQIDNMDTLDETPPEVIEITTQKGYHIRLKKLTLDIYNKSVKSRVMGSPSFKSDKDVQNFYLDSDFEISTL